MTAVVAVTTSRRGGRLDCGHRARPGQTICKVDLGERGGTTSEGNGRGAWFCEPCALGDDTAA
jgi:hypothetical protein